MLRVGLSGGIGSGKSTVARRLAELGAVVIDADSLARDVVAPGSAGLAAVADRFGAGVVRPDGSLDRAALAAIVFADAGLRRDLEAITHPLIALETKRLLERTEQDAVVVHDVPLLVEKGMGAGYHLVAVVHADEATRVARLRGERGLPEAEARRRIAAQASDAERRAAADVWLDNTGDRAALAASVDELWRDRLVPFAHNLAHGIRSRRPERLALSPPDPAWPAQAARLLGRLALAFGDAAVTLDHIGSTAVPGLLAKDVVDLQIGVTSLAVADDQVLLARLGAAGFPRVPAVDHDNAKDGGAWPKRLHGSCDPARVSHVHVRQVGAPGWRWALLFRDWLRADPEAAGRYAAEKQRLAATGMTTSDYTEAKEPWFDAAAPQAEAWARRTGWEPHHGR
jgi:dephospho-CoA kinase